MVQRFASPAAEAQVDLEAAYNNRVLVPDHPEIFARWERDAQSYRERMAERGACELGIAYGPSPRQFFDLFRAEAHDAPVAVFIHGGYWRSLHPRLFSHMAHGLVTRNTHVAVIGYDLCPEVTIADIIEQARAACVAVARRFGKHVLVIGHSAGGHLAAAMLGTDWPSIVDDASADLVPTAAAISGVFDLTPLVDLPGYEMLRLDATEARRVSPQFWPAPRGRVIDVTVGGSESSEFIRQSRDFAAAWQTAGVETRYETLAGANHFTVLDPLADPQSPMVGRLAALRSWGLA